MKKVVLILAAIGLVGAGSAMTASAGIHIGIHLPTPTVIFKPVPSVVIVAQPAPVVVHPAPVYYPAPVIRHAPRHHMPAPPHRGSAHVKCHYHGKHHCVPVVKHKHHHHPKSHPAKQHSSSRYRH